MTPDELANDAMAYSRKCRELSFHMAPKVIRDEDDEGKQIDIKVSVDDILAAAEKIYTYLMKG